MNKKYVWIGILVVTIALSLVGTGAGEIYVIGAEWEYDMIDPGDASESFGWYSSLGVDADGNIAIIHADYDWNKLRYTHWNGSGWESEYISENWTANIHDMYTVSAAWDSNGIAHAASSDAADEDVLHTYWNGTGWETEIASVAGNSEYVSIAVDSNGYPHIVYYDSGYDLVGGGSDNGLIYAAWNGISWDIEPIDAGSEEYYYPSITIDSNDKPHVSYSLDFVAAPEQLWYGKKTGVSWTLVPVITDIRCMMSNIALDSNDKPHIVFADWTNYCLGYVEKTGSSWGETYLNCNEVYAPSITIDENDHPHIAYIALSVFNANLYYAMYDGYEWYGEIVDGTHDTFWYGTDIMLHNETVHISYQRYQSDQSLKYATYNLTYMEWEDSNGIYGNVYLLPLYSPGKNTDITCSNNIYNTSTTTNTTGYYIFDNLAAGMYWINATLYNYIDNFALVEVVEGYNQTLLSGCDAL